MQWVIRDLRNEIEDSLCVFIRIFCLEYFIFFFFLNVGSCLGRVCYNAVSCWVFQQKLKQLCQGTEEKETQIYINCHEKSSISSSCLKLFLSGDVLTMFLSTSHSEQNKSCGRKKSCRNPKGHRSFPAHQYPFLPRTRKDSEQRLKRQCLLHLERGLSFV